VSQLQALFNGKKWQMPNSGAMESFGSKMAFLLDSLIPNFHTPAVGFFVYILSLKVL
jgi:hypothetical protein